VTDSGSSVKAAKAAKAAKNATHRNCTLGQFAANVTARWTNS
jgi:hypothetical protein